MGIVLSKTVHTRKQTDIDWRTLRRYSNPTVFTVNSVNITVIFLLRLWTFRQIFDDICMKSQINLRQKQTVRYIISIIKGHYGNGMNDIQLAS